MGDFPEHGLLRRGNQIVACGCDLVPQGMGYKYVTVVSDAENKITFDRFHVGRRWHKILRTAVDTILIGSTYDGITNPKNYVNEAISIAKEQFAENHPSVDDQRDSPQLMAES